MILSNVLNKQGGRLMTDKREKSKRKLKRSRASPLRYDLKHLLKAPNLTPVQLEAAKMIAPPDFYQDPPCTTEEFLKMNNAQRGDIFSRTRGINVEWAKRVFSVFPRHYWILVVNGQVIDACKNPARKIPSWDRIAELAKISGHVPVVYFQKPLFFETPDDT